jgi:hypothetical protein
MFERNYDVLWCSYGDQVTEKAEEKRKAVWLFCRYNMFICNR